MKKQPMDINEYTCWIQSISEQYRRSQIKAAIAVNSEMLKFYFSLGRDIVHMEADQEWGSGFLKRLSVDLKTQMPGASCFSPRNLYYMRSFYELYSGEEFLPQAEAKLDDFVFKVPWGHHKCIIDKFSSNPKKAIFYVDETVKNGWSRSVLLHFMDTGLYERQGKAVTNFETVLPEVDCDLAQEITKDPYCFDFAALTPRYREKELKDAMMVNIEKFLLELGQGFMLVGREYRLEVGAKEVFADLLFFHMGLNRYIVVEVKACDFEASYLGQLGLYVSAVNHILKKPEHEPTIGLLVCKSKDNTMVKWALESVQQPIGVSEYQISEALPEEIESDLPTIEEIELGIGGGE